MRILGVDPGSEKSAFVVVDFAGTPQVLEHDILENGKALSLCREGFLPGYGAIGDCHAFMEEIYPYGPKKPMPKSCLQTQRWIGRF